MRYRHLLPSLLTLGTLGLAACGEDPTQPNTAAEPSPGAPEFALVPTNTWRGRADMWGVDRSRYAAVNTTNALGQTIVYVIGGLSLYGNPLGTVMAYNVYTNSWTVKAPLPVPLYATNGAGAINGKLYISGGCMFPTCIRNGYSPRLYMYDPATNAWTLKSPMPDGGYGGVTGVLGGKLYVLTTCIEGDAPYFYDCDQLRSDSTGSRLARYDPATNRWTRLRQADATYNMGAFIGGKFYVARATRSTFGPAIPGGLAVYDPATNRWTRKANPPGLMGSAAVEVRNKLYVVGASVRINPDETFDTLLTTRVYDPTTNAWSTKAPIPSPRLGVVARRVYLNGQTLIEVVGGSRPGNNLQYAP